MMSAIAHRVRRHAGMALAAALPCAVQAMSFAPPQPGSLACASHKDDWFAADMRPAFQLQVLPGGRYRIDGGEFAGEGRLSVGEWQRRPGDEAIVSLFDRGALVMFLGADGQPFLGGIVGDKGGKASWLLRRVRGEGPVLRCGDLPSAQERKTSGPVRGIDQPTPPVRLPAGSRIGGTFEAGRYGCVTTLYGGKTMGTKTFDNTYDFYADGSWRHGTETGSYAVRPDTGRFDAYTHSLKNNTYHPDEEFTIYYRGADGRSRLYGEEGSVSRSDTQCVRSGPAVGESPLQAKAREQREDEAARLKRQQEAAERGRRNLQPPPPGQARWTGLYAKETTQHRQTFDPGPLGGFSRLVDEVTSSWEFLDFQSNGYVYLGLRKPDTRCDRPVVDDHGDPLCTSYSVDGGRLRIGLDDRGAVKRSADALQVGAEAFLAVPPLTPQRLAGAYQAGSCYGPTCEEASWVFGADGSFSAFGTHKAFGVGAGVAGTPMPRMWTNAQSLKGRYRIQGQVLEITDEQGQTGVLSIFLYPPRDTVLSVNGREYLRAKR